MKSVSVARNSPVDTRAPGTCVRRCRDVRVCVSARNHAAAPPLMAAVDPRAPWKPPSSHRATRSHRRSLAAPSRRPACKRRSSLSLFRLCMLRATTTLDRVEAAPQVLALAHERPHRARQRNNARGDSHTGRQTSIVPVIRERRESASTEGAGQRGTRVRKPTFSSSSCSSAQADQPPSDGCFVLCVFAAREDFPANNIPVTPLTQKIQYLSVILPACLVIAVDIAACARRR